MGNTSYGIDIPTTSTRAGRISRPPPRLIESATMAQAMNKIPAEYKCELTPAEEKLYDVVRELNEMALIGAGAMTEKVKNLFGYESEHHRAGRRHTLLSSGEAN
jgi:hypothetical protein